MTRMQSGSHVTTQQEIDRLKARIYRNYSSVKSKP